MKKIPLTQGRFALVDNGDYEILSQYKWSYYKLYVSRNGSTKNGIKRKTILMHREIMQPPDDKVVDHINGNILDNRRCNLRICTQHQNSFNCKKSKNNKSGHNGVSWFKRDKCWRAYINYEYKQIHLGYFKTKAEAAEAYNEAATKLYGQFRKQNSFRQRR